MNKIVAIFILVAVPFIISAQYRHNIVLIAPLTFNSNDGLKGELQYRYNFDERVQGLVGFGFNGNTYKEFKAGYRYQVPIKSKFTFGFGADLFYGIHTPELDGADLIYKAFGIAPELEFHYLPTKHLDLFAGSGIKIKLAGDKIEYDSSIFKLGIGYRF